MFRRGTRVLWQLTPSAASEHRAALAADVAGARRRRTELRHRTTAFLDLNERFKALCGDWQLRDGDPNDHADAAYDRCGASTGSVELDDDGTSPVVVAASVTVARTRLHAVRAAPGRDVPASRRPVKRICSPV